MDISYFDTEVTFFLPGDLKERGKYEKTSETGSTKGFSVSIYLSFIQNLKIENAYIEIQWAIFTLGRNEISWVTRHLVSDVSS